MSNPILSHDQSLERDTLCGFLLSQRGGKVYFAWTCFTGRNPALGTHAG